jgi:cation transport regulator ChaB
MFRKNDQHLQQPLFSGLNELPDKVREQLEQSWAGTFYREIFVRIDEQLYARLYADEPSRPNIPVNVLVGLEMLKDGNGWSDQELYENYCYNLQVRYALGLRNLADGHFELRTVYNFRQRLSRHMQQTGENLFNQTFEQITDEQLAAYALKTHQQRMDSTQIGSNIRAMSRLQLLVEVLQRVYRALSPADQEAWADDFAPYLKGSSGQYLYRLKGPGAHQPHLEAIGQLMHRLQAELAATYAQTAVYQLLTRVFAEHFNLVEAQAQPKTGAELSATSLQSPDDWEASYRWKGDEGHIGYVANAAETCHPDNPFQLVVNMQTAPNSTDDPQLLVEATPSLKQRTNLTDMNTDGGYGSPKVDEMLAAHGIELHQTAIRGRAPAPDKFDLADCQWELDDNQRPLAVITPQGERVKVEAGRSPDRYILRFAPTPPADQSPDTSSDQPTAEASAPPSKNPPQVLYFSQQQVALALRRQRSAQLRVSGKNPRAAIEATMGALKRPFGNNKVPVRGQFRVGMLMIGSAAMINLRRIWRFQAEQRKEAAKTRREQPSGTPLPQFFQQQIAAYLSHFYSIVRFNLLHC